jgi:NAD(P)-dependent dehydrogenase (short-subunit alcohol dehydrogenase family)
MSSTPYRNTSVARDFSGKVAIVTGSASGIGAAAARQLAARGASLIVADIDLSKAEVVAAEIRKSDGNAVALEVDVAHSHSVANMVDFAQRQYGALHLAVNNAGIIGTTDSSMGDYALDTWASVIAVNLTGVFHCLKYELRAILASGSGAVVNTASGASLSRIRSCRPTSPVSMPLRVLRRWPHWNIPPREYASTA